MPAAGGVRERLVGRMFVHPLFDYLCIGGGLSLVVTALVVWHPLGRGIVDASALPYVVLISNAAHFAASTVRLYAKPGSYRAWPFLTMALPLVALLLLTLCMFLPGSLGPHLQSLYLTWSPYHYAAQAYGLAVMYALSLGLPPRRRRQEAAVVGGDCCRSSTTSLTAPGVGLRWLLPEAWLAGPSARDAHGRGVAPDRAGRGGPLAALRQGVARDERTAADPLAAHRS